MGEPKLWQKKLNNLPGQMLMLSFLHPHKSRKSDCLLWQQNHFPDRTIHCTMQKTDNFVPQWTEGLTHHRHNYRLEKQSEGWPILYCTHILLIILQYRNQGHRTSIILPNCREGCPVLLNISPEKFREKKNTSFCKDNDRMQESNSKSKVNKKKAKWEKEHRKWAFSCQFLFQ